MNEKIEALKSSFDSELKKIANMVDLEALRVNYLGRKGKVTDALKGMGGLTDEQKKTVGRETNELKTAITVALAEKLEALKAQELQREINALPEFDISMPPDMTRGRITRLRWCSASASRCSSRWASRWRITPRS